LLDYWSTVASGGMISFFDLQSAFDLVDDNDDGIISYREAMTAVDSAFSGTVFHGADIVKETLSIVIVSSDNNNNNNDDHHW
jgi:Ca2+-binding EF-hand superfamily protein